MGNPISLVKVYNDLKSQGYSIGKDTVYDYVSHLEEAFIMFKTDIWHRSVRAQSINPSKYYCIDPAFKYAMSIGEDQGRVLENAFFLHLRRQGLAPHYFLEKQEVDFYWENGQLVNVCYDFYENATRERELKGMVAALKSLDLKEGLILTRDKTEEIKVSDKTVIVRPAWQYFLEKK
jgi:predicted AAA+ superfamily ATPase